MQYHSGIYNLILLFCVIKSSFLSGTKNCSSKKFDSDSFVCVCNSTFCDDVEKNLPIKLPKFTIYTSDKSKHRLHKTTGEFNAEDTNNSVEVSFVFDTSTQYQSVIGFGGALTDATLLNVKQLPLDARKKLMNSYFSENGIEYNLLRIPIASCDFSTHAYSYDDVKDDFNLTHFSIADEDLNLRIPAIKEAQQISKKDIWLFASAWSAPGWMKTNNNMSHVGWMKGDTNGKYWKTWAQYYVKYFQKYKENNITFWGLTTGNEPFMCVLGWVSYQCMGISPWALRDFVSNNLGPSLNESGFGYLKILAADDSRFTLPVYTKFIRNSAKAYEYVSGFAVHWYDNFLTPQWFLSLTKWLAPEKFILATEACNGYMHNPSMRLGSWSDAEAYSHNIIQDLNNWVSGWTDWNMALDTQGGPNYVGNFVNSPVVVNKNEFYKQPMFYILGHFSKFIKRNSRRVKVNSIGDLKGLEYTAFLTPENCLVFIVSNRNNYDVEFDIKDPSSEKKSAILSNRRSIMTILLWLN